MSDYTAEERDKTRALLQELLDVVYEGEAMDDHTGLANWLVDFAPKVKAALEGQGSKPVRCGYCGAERDANGKWSRVVNS